MLSFFRDKVLAAARPRGQDGGLGREVTLREASMRPSRASPPTSPPNRTSRHPSATPWERPTCTWASSTLPIRQHERAMTLRTARTGSRAPRHLDLHGQPRRGLPARRPGRPKRSRFSKRCWRSAAATLGPDHPDTPGTVNNLAVAYQDAGRVAEAIPLLEQALRLFQRKYSGPDHRRHACFDEQSGRGLQDVAGRPSEAVPLFEKVLAIRKAKLPPDHPDLLTSINNLAGDVSGHRPRHRRHQLLSRSCSPFAR